VKRWHISPGFARPHHLGLALCQELLEVLLSLRYKIMSEDAGHSFREICVKCIQMFWIEVFAIASGKEENIVVSERR